MQELLKQLKKEYLASLPDKIKKLNELTSQKDIEGLREVFHQLKGSGKSYGVEDITTLSAQMEHLTIKKPIEALQLAPDACQLIQKITQAATNEQNYVLTADELYQKIERICKMLSTS